MATVDLINCNFNTATQVSNYYPNAPTWDGAGVDTIVCQIDPLGESRDVPTVPIMSPQGALRDHLRYEMYYVHNNYPWQPKTVQDSDGPDITVVGTGKHNNNGSYGPKRALDIMLVRQYDGSDDGYSTTNLATNDTENSGGGDRWLSALLG